MLAMRRFLLLLLTSTNALMVIPVLYYFFLQISIMCHLVSLFNMLSSLLFTGIVCVGGDGIVNEVSSVPMFLSLYELNQDTILLCCFWVIFFFAFSTYINHVCAGLFFFVALIKATILSSELLLTSKSSYLLPPFQIVGHFGKSRCIFFAMYLDIVYI